MRGCCCLLFKMSASIHRMPAPAADVHAESPTDSLQIPGEVGWGEVEHWTWPLFTESWQHWRREALGLAPFLSAAQDGALPPATPLLYGLPESIVPRPGFWPDSVRMCGFWLDTQVSRLC